MLTVVLTVWVSFVVALTGDLLNNQRFNDGKELLRAEVRATQADAPALREVLRAELTAVRVEMAGNQSELLARFAEIDQRIARLEQDRRVLPAG